MQNSEWPLHFDGAEDNLDGLAVWADTDELDADTTSVVDPAASTGWSRRMRLNTARVTPWRQGIVFAMIRVPDTDSNITDGSRSPSPYLFELADAGVLQVMQARPLIPPG